MAHLLLSDDAATLHSAEGVWVHQYWHSGFGCRLRPHEDYAPERAQVPDLFLLAADGALPPRLPDFAREVLGSVPYRLRRLAAPFGHVWLALEALRHVEGFDDFLAQELAGAGPNFVVACWELTEAWCRTPSERCALAAAMMRRRRAALLAELSGFIGFDDVHVRLITKLPTRDVCAQVIADLVGLTTDPAVRQTVVMTSRLSRAVIATLRQLPPWLHHPAIDRILAEEQVLAESLGHALTEIIRSAAEADRKRLRASLATATTWAELFGLLMRWDERLRRAIPFPPPPIPGDHRLRPLATIDALEREGRFMRHCVAGYEDEVHGGNSYFYAWLGDERATVQLDHDGEEWRLAEYLGFGNARLSEATIAAIRQLVDRQVPRRPFQLNTYVAGTAFYQAAEALARLRPGTPLLLRRQPGNPYDSRAIEVVTRDGLKLGYIPRVHNAEPAARLDRGELLDARVALVRGTIRMVLTDAGQPTA